MIQCIPLSMTCLNQNEIQKLTIWGLIVSTIVRYANVSKIHLGDGRKVLRLWRNYKGQICSKDNPVYSYSRIGTSSKQGIYHLLLEIKT